MIYKISEEEVSTLENLISTTSKSKDNQEEQLTETQDYINNRRYVLPDIDIEYYSTDNKELNKKLSEILKVDDVVPITIHKFKYENGAHSKRHKDLNSNQTFVIILEDDYEGGDFYLNDELTDFRNRGDVATYVGNESHHYVTPITKGTRTVLVVWYPKKDTLI